MQWRLGTIGFSHEHWIGPFYPRALKTADYLRFYADHFDTIELDTTFYAAPDANRVRRWRDETPAAFRFTVKAPRDITHEGTLDKNVAAMSSFLDVLTEFGEKLGAVLLQFPPGFAASESARLDEFLSNVPRTARLAVEFRHRSWFTPRAAALLRKHHVAFVAADLTGVPRQIIQTSDFLYVRWIGEYERFLDRYGTEQFDATERIDEWKRHIEKRADTIETIYGFFGNDFSGDSIGSANKLRRMVGLPVKESSGEPQQKLF